MTLFDYITWRSDLRFSQDPLNEIDMVLFSILVYWHWAPVVGSPEDADPVTPTLADAAAALKDAPPHQHAMTISAAFDEQIATVLERISQTPRYADVRLAYFSEKTDFTNGLQFAAITILLPDDSDDRFFVVFRGTDNTWIGWQEDFEILYKETLPAQEAAAAYLCQVVSRENGPFCVAGHSKGGNLAVYAASSLAQKDLPRLRDVASFDGLGFNVEFSDPSTFDGIRDKVTNYMPKYTVVSQLMPLIGKHVVIDSDTFSTNHHLPFFWSVLGNHFVTTTISDFSVMVRDITASWLSALSVEDRRLFISSTFSLLGASDGNLTPRDARNTLELLQALLKKMPLLQNDTQRELNRVMRQLSDIAMQHITATVKSRMRALPPDQNAPHS